MSSRAEIFLFNSEVVLYTITEIIGLLDDDKIKVKATSLLKRFGVEGEKVFLKYSTFILPTKIIRKSEDYIILDFPTLTPEKPLGDRKSVRVKPSPEKPVKIKINNVEKDIYDISEVGFSLKCSQDEIERFSTRVKSNSVVIELPNEESKIQGKAKLINVRELENGDILCGYELFLDDTDMVKIRFYIYERVKEILKGVK
ncbi:MAG TPA: hypothetical protein EYP32_00485 [Aquificaceae bacterium]|nr:hypothetical protein [Aquificaceae bacterium]